MPITFIERYNNSQNWHEKAIIIEIFHLSRQHNGSRWTITHTANYFGVSIGLVSENLKLADAIHKDERILKCQSRQEALRKIK